MAQRVAAAPARETVAPTCDVMHCWGERRHNYRLCIRCDCRLPTHLRVGIIAAHEQRRIGDWNRLRKEAGKYLNLTPRDPAAPIGAAPQPAPVFPAPLPQRVSPQRSYELQQRILGERPDA